MADIKKWRVLIVDDEQEICDEVKEYLELETINENEGFEVDTLEDIEPADRFNVALERLSAKNFDLVILDLRLGPKDNDLAEEAGAKTFKAIQERCFIPVIFYSGLAHKVASLEGPVVRVLAKGDKELTDVFKAVTDLINTKLPTLNRALTRHVQEVQREYMWEFVLSHWDQFRDTSDNASLAYLLARRLAVSLSGTGIQKLVEELDGSAAANDTGGMIHPMQYYLMPPVEEKPLAGDIYKSTNDGADAYQVLLSPSCDLHQGKTELALLARCVPITEQAEYKSSKEEGRASNRLKQLLKNNRDKPQSDRFHFLPGVFSMPDLIVDFQDLKTMPYDQLSSLDRFASLDNPFAEALLARFVRYFGRMGTPDLNLTVVLNRMGFQS